MTQKLSFLKNHLVTVNIISSIALIIAIGSAVFFYTKYQKSLSAKNNPVSDVESTAAAVSKLMELPAESPTLATVSDVEKLKGQDFFEKAKNGDKVLIYKVAKKAILYRPFTNKIIEVGPIQIETPSVAGTATASAQTVSPSIIISPTIIVSPTISVTPASASATISVAVYNGTKINGLSKKTADSLVKEFSDIKIQSTGNAKGDYKKTVVVDLSKKNKSKAAEIEKFLKGEVGSVPKGEATPEADILVVVGTSN